MNENPDPFESRLAALPTRPVPSHLRRRILSTAPHAASPASRAAGRVPWHRRWSWSWTALAGACAFVLAASWFDGWANGTPSPANAVSREQRLLARQLRDEAFGVAGISGPGRGAGTLRDAAPAPDALPAPRGERRRVPTGFVGHVADDVA